MECVCEIRRAGITAEQVRRLDPQLDEWRQALQFIIERGMGRAETFRSTFSADKANQRGVPRSRGKPETDSTLATIRPRAGGATRSGSTTPPGRPPPTASKSCWMRRATPTSCGPAAARSGRVASST